jgi:3-deoxy-D-manno-octulosonate 8-phosphate phosphatase (KDO 8-P phosphatase)
MYKLFAMDVDGTMTDGGVYVDGKGDEFKRFNIQDGMGIALFRRAGGKTAVISGRYSAATQRRVQELHFDYVANGCNTDKLSVLREFAARAGVKAEEVVYAGDDINDIECVKWSGLGIAVANAVSQLCEVADYVTKKSGGDGAIREIADMILALNAAEDKE